MRVSTISLCLALALAQTAPTSDQGCGSGQNGFIPACTTTSQTGGVCCPTGPQKAGCPEVDQSACTPGPSPTPSPNNGPTPTPTPTNGDGSSSGAAKASLRGNVALTTVVGTTNNKDRPVGTNIYGCMEAGFGAQQDQPIKNIAGSSSDCYSDPSIGYLAAGIDTQTAGSMFAQQCGIDNAGLDLDDCGGHVPGAGYHLHQELACLYDSTAQGHSTQIGQAVGRSQYLYGKYEDSSTLPQLDACGGHWGTTPDSNGASVYHYHVQTAPPFTIGCYGPDLDANNQEILVTVDKCRSLYTECSEPATASLTLKGGSTVDYKYDCPCFDGAGSNTGTATLAVFSNGDTVPNPGSTTPTPTPAPSPATTPTPAPTPATTPTPTPTTTPTPTPTPANGQDEGCGSGQNGFIPACTTTSQTGGVCCPTGPQKAGCPEVDQSVCTPGPVPTPSPNNNGPTPSPSPDPAPTPTPTNGPAPGPAPFRVQITATFSDVTVEDLPNIATDIASNYNVSVDRVTVVILPRRRRADVNVKITIAVADQEAATALQAEVQATQPVFTATIAANPSAALVGVPTITVEQEPEDDCTEPAGNPPACLQNCSTEMNAVMADVTCATATALVVCADGVADCTLPLDYSQYSACKLAAANLDCSSAPVLVGSALLALLALL